MKRGQFFLFIFDSKPRELLSFGFGFHVIKIINIYTLRVYGIIRDIIKLSLLLIVFGIGLYVG